MATSAMAVAATVLKLDRSSLPPLLKRSRRQLPAQKKMKMTRRRGEGLTFGW